MVVLIMRRLRLSMCLVCLVTPAISSTAIPQTPPPRVIEITAERFEFWPSEITVVEGEQVEFRITSEDTVHGFRIVGHTVNLIIPKRGKGVATGVFTASEPGRYIFECHRMCGAGHSFMRGSIVVRPRPGSSR
jgi:heme/copper-type cytochrome/quinol oxidase subunit 2